MTNFKAKTKTAMEAFTFISDHMANNKNIPDYVELNNLKFGQDDYIDALKRFITYIDTNNKIPQTVTFKNGSKIETKPEPTPIPEPTPEPEPETTITTRPVWIVSDNIYISNSNPNADKNNVQNIIDQLVKLGITAKAYGYGPNKNLECLESKTVEDNALVVEIAGGADAGSIYEKAGDWYKGLKGNRKDIIVLMDTALEITGLDFLERAHDDNYTKPLTWPGLEHPDQFLINNGYPYIEGISRDNITPAVQFIYQQSIIKTTVNKSMQNVLNAAKTVTTYIQDNRKAPESITVGETSLNVSSFCRMLAATIYQLGTGATDEISMAGVGDAPNPVTGISTGQLMKTDYLSAANALVKFIDENQKMPNYLTTALGKMSPFNVLDMFSRALNFYVDEKILPNYINVQSVAGNINTDPNQYPDDVKAYLQPTNNCQSNDPEIVALAAELGSGEAIFNYERDGMTYDYYYNTKLGAVKALKSMVANCCDQTHLLIALLRAANIPARYRHVTAKFSDGVFGHVLAQAYVSGEWLDCDTISRKNSFGVINNWELVEEINIYKELPF